MRITPEGGWVSNHRLVILLLGCVLIACTTAPDQAATSPPPPPDDSPDDAFAPQLLSGEVGTIQDLQPTDEEIAAATARLDEDSHFIMVIAPILTTDYHFTVARAARQRAEDLDLPIEVESANADPLAAVSLIESAVERGVGVIIIDIFDPSMHDALAAAQTQGVLIVQYAGRTGADLGALTVSVEDDELGRVAGQYAGQLIREERGGRAQVAILDFPDAPQVVIRADAMREALLSEAPDAEIVGSYVGGITDFAVASMTQALADFPQIDVVVSINDAGAYGAYQVLEVAGRTADDTIIVGIDGEAQALEYIAADTMYRGTVDTGAAVTGEMTVNAAIRLLAGAAVPQNIELPVTLITIESLPE